MAADPETLKGRLPIREYGLRERYRGALLANPSYRIDPPPRGWAEGFHAGVLVALACAREALAHRGNDPLDPQGWAGGRARKSALDPDRVTDLRPDGQVGDVDGPQAPTPEDYRS